ncbi:preprotein translocase subunit [Tetragenococcus muriaticus PMC-11-5]|uniref:Preprotein translocase subunit n=1 Tax=Tetragenococcus muriaticus PMC-11-5 TaxID=1302649 RepID=A0A091C7H4_9ENTE|nr:preprotein translocase subunit [Tetragenococcus muriaticus PMC-11-5]
MKFIRSVKDEMKKVTWPTGKQLRKDTLVVIEMALIFTVSFLYYGYRYSNSFYLDITVKLQ